MAGKTVLDGALGRKLAALPRLLDAELRKAVAEAAEAIRDDAIKSLRSGGSRTAKGRASAPGEPPARQSGRLQRSIVVELDPSRPSAKVIATADYARALEFGTRRMAARPFLRPALERNRAKTLRLIREAVAAAIAAARRQ
jgi:HK97 gp10 family phage protein